LRSHTKATIARTAANARRPVEASISGTLATEDPIALSLPPAAEDDTEDEPEEDRLTEDDPPEPPCMLEPPDPPGRLERPPIAKTAAEDIANVVAVASAVAASLNTVTVRSLNVIFYTAAHCHR
jgi:hypothetical protein